MMKICVTVIIPVRNEQHNLPQCLSQLADFDQVLVIDSSSTDRTPEITSENEVEYVNFIWNGKFPKKRNWALRSLEIRNEWVLFLDADEIVTNRFKEEISLRIKDKSYNGFWVTYQNHFMGKRLKYGDQMRKLPLFRKGTGEYERIDEDHWSSLDMEVHEHPVINGKIGRIKSPIIHYDYKGLDHYIARHNAYSTWEARRFLSLSNAKETRLTFRQKIKYKLLMTGFLPFLYFIVTYVFKFGFLDGRSGRYLARYKANYFFQIQTKVAELKMAEHI